MKIVREGLGLPKNGVLIPFSSQTKQGREEVYELIENLLAERTWFNLMKIFIVEDDENIVELLGDELRAWGYETMSVKDFNNVAEEVEEFKSDLVLMDITLPYYNGFYWTQKIRENSNVPIIFISSHNNSMDMVSAMQFGADDYITKPVDINLTRVKIQAILRRTYEYTMQVDKLTFEGISLDTLRAKLTGGKTFGYRPYKRPNFLYLKPLF